MTRSNPHLAATLALAASLVACAPQPGPVAPVRPSATPSTAVLPTATPAPAASPKASASPAAVAKAADAEGCEHMTEGPARAASATLVAEGRGVVALDHTRYDVALVPQGGSFAGSVTLNSKAAGHVKVYLGFEGAASEALPLTLFQDGKAIAFESSDTKTAHAACPAIKHLHVAPVGVGPVELRFGPTARAKVSVVLEAEAEEGHDDHDHQ